MEHAEMKQAPSLAGWAIAAGAGLVAFGVTLVVMGFGPMQAAFVGILIFLVVGLILGMPRAERGMPVAAAAHEPASVPVVKPVSAPAPVVAPLAAAAPLMSMADPAPVAPVTVASARRPVAMTAARGGKADDLKAIEGIGPKMEELCNSLGFYHFDQIAAWTSEETAWVDDNLPGFKGRVTRDKWVAQAKLIVTVGMDEFLRRAKTNDY